MQALLYSAVSRFSRRLPTPTGGPVSMEELEELTMGKMAVKFIMDTNGEAPRPLFAADAITFPRKQQGGKDE